jgi:hypothetical protein
VYCRAVNGTQYDSFGYFSDNNMYISNWVGDMIFRTGTGGSTSEKMRISSNGNVGINSSPADNEAKFRVAVTSPENVIEARIESGAHNCTGYISYAAHGVTDFDYFGAYQDGVRVAAIDGGGVVYASGGVRFSDSSLQTTAAPPFAGGTYHGTTGGSYDVVSQVFPSGMIMQMGRAEVDGGSYQTIYFPISMGSIYTAQATGISIPGGFASQAVSVGYAHDEDPNGYTPNSITVYNPNYGHVGIRWFVIGYY